MLSGSKDIRKKWQSGLMVITYNRSMRGLGFESWSNQKIYACIMGCDKCTGIFS